MKVGGRCCCCYYGQTNSDFGVDVQHRCDMVIKLLSEVTSWSLQGINV